MGRGRRAVDLRARARGDADRARRGRHRPLLPARADACASGSLRCRVFEGEIVGVIGAGAFVSFGEAGEFEGMLPVRRMREDWWELNEWGTALIGTRSGGALALGDPVRGAGRRHRRAPREGGSPARCGYTRLTMAKSKRKAHPGDVASNRQASFRFNLLERFECGIVLEGTEVKALREGKAQLKDAYATIRDERGVADRHVHPALRPGLAGEPRSGAPAQAAAAPARDREDDRPHAREGVDARSHARLLLRAALTGEGRDRDRVRQEPVRQASTRSGTATWRATCSGSCARRSGERRRSPVGSRVGSRRYSDGTMTASRAEEHADGGQTEPGLGRTRDGVRRPAEALRCAESEPPNEGAPRVWVHGSSHLRPSDPGRR